MSSISTKLPHHKVKHSQSNKDVKRRKSQEKKRKRIVVKIGKSEEKKRKRITLLIPYLFSVLYLSFRPADGNETVGAYIASVENPKTPVCISLSRQVCEAYKDKNMNKDRDIKRVKENRL